jgi:hypothetical protein
MRKNKKKDATNQSNHNYSEDEGIPYVHYLQGGVSQVRVVVSFSTKSLGVDASLTMGEVYDFAIPTSDGEAIVRRSEMVDILRDQVIAEAKVIVESIREVVPTDQKGMVHTRTHPTVFSASTQTNHTSPDDEKTTREEQ